MYAYNPQSGRTIEISESGFKMLEIKGWTRHADQSQREGSKPKEALPPPPVFDMKDEMEKKRKEVAEKKLQDSLSEMNIRHLPGATVDIVNVPDAPKKIVENIENKKPKAVTGNKRGPKPKQKPNETN